MPVRVWTHDCITRGCRRYDGRAVCLECGERAEFSHWAATFRELRDRVLKLGGGRAPARLSIDPCPMCHGHGWVGTVDRYRTCAECGGRGFCNDDPVPAEAGDLHPRAQKPGPHSSAARRRLWAHDPNQYLLPMVGAVPYCLDDWPADPRTGGR